MRSLLDGGFDPNSATADGTTALMMAAPDAAKLKLLMDHEANVNARAKTGYSALMVAAQYGESATPALNLLLDHGAEVRVAAGQHAPMFNATPFFLASYSGNAEILPRLHEAGDKLDHADGADWNVVHNGHRRRGAVRERRGGAEAAGYGRAGGWAGTQRHHVCWIAPCWGIK